jgi:hypothetical protein
MDLFGNDNGAIFSDDRKYRYAIWRIWDKEKPLVMFIGLNPSKANESESDNTITKVKKIASHNGFGGFYMMNCWAYISTDPKLLMHSPLSDEWNNNMLTAISAKCKEVVFAWGNFKIIRDKGRDLELIKMFPNAKALHINNNGSPKHPLYCKDETILIPFKNTNT